MFIFLILLSISIKQLKDKQAKTDCEGLKTKNQEDTETPAQPSGESCKLK
jgi:hypothetical protein